MSVADDDQRRGYEVILVARTTNEHYLQPLVELPEGITATVEGSEVLLTIPVRAPDARTALVVARETATDLLLVLASTFNSYELVIDKRQITRRTDAVYRAEGSPPPLDVAEGVVTECGVRSLDPDGELRRTGRVVTIRASAFVTHSPVEDVRRFAGRGAWSTRLRHGLTLFHAAQNTRDEVVEFTLTVAAMEVLADADETPLLDKLSEDSRVRLHEGLDGLLDGFDLSTDERRRLASRLLDTKATGSAQAIRSYLTGHGVEVGDLRWWQKQRGNHLHDGVIEDDPQRRYRLRHAIGVCLAAELDHCVAESVSV
ncbi:MAG: hypothetical protein ACRDRS_19600 [Pseudonocardiaceae bacterium]